MGNDLADLFGLALREGLRERPKTDRRVAMATVIGVSDEGTALVQFDGDEDGGQHEVTPLARVTEGSRVLVDFTPGGGAYVLGTPGGTDAPAGRIAYAESSVSVDCLNTAPGGTTVVLSTTFNTNEARLLRMEGQVSGIGITNSSNSTAADITLGLTTPPGTALVRRIGEVNPLPAFPAAGSYVTFFGGLWTTSLVGEQTATMRIVILRTDGAITGFRLNPNYTRFIAVVDYGRA